MCPTSITRNNTSLFKYSALTLCLSALLQPVQAQEETKEIPVQCHPRFGSCLDALEPFGYVFSFI